MAVTLSEAKGLYEEIPRSARDDSIGAARDDSIGAARDDSIGAAQDDSIGAARDDNLRCDPVSEMSSCMVAEG